MDRPTLSRQLFHARARVTVIPGCGHQPGQIWEEGGWLEPPAPWLPPTSSRAGRRREGGSTVWGNWRQAGALLWAYRCQAQAQRCPGPATSKELQGCNSPVRGALTLLPHTSVGGMAASPGQEAAKLEHKPRAQAPELLLRLSLAIPPWRNSLEVKRWGFLVGFLLTSLSVRWG